jgi:hypothetical protein
MIAGGRSGCESPYGVPSSGGHAGKRKRGATHREAKAAGDTAGTRPEANREVATSHRWRMKKPLPCKGLSQVDRAGIEPATPGFSEAPGPRHKGLFSSGVTSILHRLSAFASGSLQTPVFAGFRGIGSNQKR